MRSSDRQQEGRPESGRAEPWIKELGFHTIAGIISLALYFGGTEYAMAWIRWWQHQAPSPPTACPASKNALSQQQIQHLLAVQQTIRKHQIQALTATAQHHPEQQKRVQALHALQGLGVFTPTAMPPTPELIAQSR